MANYGKIAPEIIEKIKSLRSKGHSLPEISKEVNVSRTSVLRYIRGVKILPEYLPQWIIKRGGSHKRKLLKNQRALEAGESLIGKLTDKEKLLILCSLYWAEGNKKDFILTNTDSCLIRVFVEILRQILKVTDDQLRVSIRLYEDLDREKSLDFWSKIVSIPKSQFLTTNILLGKKKGKLPFGMCRVRVIKGGDLLKKIMALNQVIANRFTDL